MTSTEAWEAADKTESHARDVGEDLARLRRDFRQREINLEAMERAAWSEVRRLRAMAADAFAREGAAAMAAALKEAK